MAQVQTCSACGAALPPDAPAGNCPRCLMLQVMPGAEPPRPFIRFFADYELLGEIAHGGMGIVYRARQISLNRTVALKMILAGHLATPPLVQRFRAEAEAAARLDHPNIVPIYEIGEHEGQHYFSMKLIEGKNLARYLEELKVRERTAYLPPIPFSTAVRLLGQVARAVHHAHERGILHRDLKPTNIIVDAAGQPHVSDFGLAKILEDDINMTHSMAVLGTPAYMAPEQAAGQAKQLTTSADIYSLGAILYELIAGRPPFRADTALGTMRMVIECEPVRPSLINLRIDRSLETICLKCLEKDPAKRYLTAQALAEDLERFERGEPVLARPVSQTERVWRWCRRKPALAGAWAALLIVFVAGFIGVFWQWRRAETSAANESAQRVQVQELATRLTLEKAEVLFTQDRAGDALAHLARVLRGTPTNRIVAQRIVSALGQRSFCLPRAALRHTGEITSLVLSPDGQRVLTASQDKTARLWDSATGKMLLELQHTGAVRTARFNHDGTAVVTACGDSAQVWDAVKGQRVGSALRHEGEVYDAEFSPTGDRVVTASADRTAHVWDARSGQSLSQPLAHGGEVMTAHFSADGKRLVTAARDKMIRIWDVESGQSVMTPFRNRLESDEVRFTPDGTQLLVGCTELFDATTGKLVAKPFTLHAPRIYSTRFSPDGQKMVTAAGDSTARLWDLQSRKPLAEPLGHDNRVNYAEFSPDGLRVLTCANDQTVRVWDALTGSALTEPLRHDAEVVSAHFTPDGQHLITQPAGNVAWIWELREEQPLTPVFKHGEAVRSAHFSKDGSRVLTASWDQTAKLWDAHTGQPLFKNLSHRSWLVSAEFSPDETRIVTASHDKTARVWDAQTGEAISRITHRDAVLGAEFSPDGKQVLTASQDGTAQVWNLVTGESQSGLLKHDAAVHAAHFSADGQRVVTASDDQTARVWDTATGRELIPALSHPQAVLNARFTPDGQRIVTVALDDVARVWNARTGQRLLEVPHDGEFASSAPQFSPDGRRVATAARNTVRIWDLETGRMLVDPITHPERITSVQFDPAGKRIVTTSKDHTARLWDAQTGLQLGEALMHTNGVIHAEFSRDGRWVVTASYDGLARVWEVPEFSDDAPIWLPALAEAVGGKRLDARSFVEPVSVEELFRLATSLGGLPGNSYTRWAGWFTSNNVLRSVSPSSSITFAEYAGQRLRENSVESLQRAARLAPTNGLTFARLAMLAFDQTNREPRAGREMWWQAAHAADIAPHEVETWLIYAKMLERDGRNVEALKVMEKAGAALPSHPAVWNAQGILLQRTNRLEEAQRVFSKAIELTEHEPGFKSVRARAFQGRSEVLKVMGRVADSRADYLTGKGIPQRATNVSSRLIDLTPHYNGGLGENWRGLYGNDDLSALPAGVQKFGDVEFDVRGVVQLSGQWLRRQGRRFPERVPGIEVGQRCERLHFLHAAGYLPGATNGMELARYVVHFVNGETQEIPVVYGRDVFRHWMRPVSSSSSGPVLAWEGKIETTKAPSPGLSPTLYRATWTNPKPDAPIAKIDLVSSMTEVDAFLVAITAE